MSTKDLIKKMNKSRDVQPDQLNHTASTMTVGRLETDITTKVEDIVERLMVEKELTAADAEAEDFEDLKTEIRSMATAFHQMKVNYAKVTERYSRLTEQVENLLRDINEVKETKKSKWKGLFS